MMNKNFVFFQSKFGEKKCGHQRQEEEECRSHESFVCWHSHIHISSSMNVMALLSSSKSDAFLSLYFLSFFPLERIASSISFFYLQVWISSIPNETYFCVFLSHRNYSLEFLFHFTSSLFVVVVVFSFCTAFHSFAHTQSKGIFAKWYQADEINKCVPHVLFLISSTEKRKGIRKKPLHIKIQAK